MQEITVRKSKMTDSELLEKAFQKAVRDDFKYYPLNAKKEFLKIWDAKFFRKRRPVTFIALKNDNIVGFIIGNPEWQSSGVATIDWLWVSASHRNQKVGTNLMQAIENYFKETNHHKVVLNADNKLTQNFYKKVGYSIEGEMKDHFWHLNEKRYAKRLTR